MSSMEVLQTVTLCSLAVPPAAQPQRPARSATLAKLRTILEKPAPIALRPLATDEIPSFDNRLASMRDILAPETFGRIGEEIGGLVETERSFIPTHKKGGTIAYETLIANAPQTVSLYHCAEFHRILSAIVGQKVMPTPPNDQSSLSVLFYERPGDHIGWHFDHDFYRGRHFTVLVAIENRGHQAGGLSAATLLAKQDGKDIAVPTAPNTFVFFEGAKVLHKVTPIESGERRVMLSMTFATDTRSTLAMGIARRFKDTAFFGIRALWT
jgi:hypothetical protein